MASSDFLRLGIINVCIKGIEYWNQYKEKIIFEETERIINNNLQNLLDAIKENPNLNKTYNISDISSHFAKKYVDELINILPRDTIEIKSKKK